eukprot:CAMPEP_0172738342 /NCGR_PEP_ID=MMETSP1074-20121228/119999_1 /TAXON_ID=2916 /ORGANISM="Ceratium fusus, Strain PA161109" /LENGTH=35 /DNA_ID= /DNA_START= /DNA_END= /DNA_ORIENTATION=
MTTSRGLQRHMTQSPPSSAEPVVPPGVVFPRLGFG